MDLSEKEYYALLRTDLSAFIHRTFQTVCPGETFIPNWHIDTIAYHLQQCLSGDIKRLVITLPPRSLKSIITSVAFPAFVLGKDPSKQIVCTSYSQVLTDKHANDHLAIMQNGRIHHAASLLGPIELPNLEDCQKQSSRDLYQE